MTAQGLREYEPRPLKVRLKDYWQNQRLEFLLTIGLFTVGAALLAFSAWATFVLDWKM